ncbi:RNA-binding domain-containing protein [Dacryopinax primogenitus]|uniref:RNA-binding domain-containing protein n=1 Tax=Dacryopinax primogenitus (strain DJM 731) TaxID=1858805 RepID=M5G9J9_DACPD|nr:RNA-binding domain-containing protein [Dacryopinax primogenitus]EJU04940.1 RNA-binding domain-containing protein [Dacryopinax primogenitus]
MPTKTKTTKPLEKSRKSELKPRKAPKSSVPAPAEKAPTADKAKKRKLDIEQEDAVVEKKRRKSAVADGSNEVKVKKAEAAKKSKEVAKVVEALPPPAKSTKVAKKVMISEGATKGKRSKNVPEPEPEKKDDEAGNDDVEDNAEQPEEENEEDGEELHGFTSGEDSSDDDDDVDAEPIDLGKLPTIAKDDATIKRRLDKAKKQKTEERGVLYLGRIPHGFYEDQMRGYFSQFGTVTRLRLSRNKKTGKSKHYAFIEFDSLPVAEIVADATNNYLMFGRLLQCKVIPNEKVHPGLWVGANRKFRPVPRARVARLKHNKERTEEDQKKSAERLLKRQEEKKRKLAELGIDYDIDAAGFKAS